MSQAFAIQDQLLPPDSKSEVQRIAKEYYEKRYKEEENAAKYMNQTAKGIFNLMLKLSYTLFSFGIALTIKSGASLDQQKVIAYISDAEGKSFLIVLAILGFLILSILKVIKEDSLLPSETKKQFNFFVDILRTVFYTLSLVFVAPFVFQNTEQTLLLVSFWIFAFALALFVVRKVIKWKYFMLDNVGKTNLEPWKSSKLSTQQNIFIVADVHQFIQRQKKHNQLVRLLGSSKPELKKNIDLINNEVIQAQEKLRIITNLMASLQT